MVSQIKHSAALKIIFLRKTQTPVTRLPPGRCGHGTCALLWAPRSPARSWGRAGEPSSSAFGAYPAISRNSFDTALSSAQRLSSWTQSCQLLQSAAAPQLEGRSCLLSPSLHGPRACPGWFCELEGVSQHASVVMALAVKYSYVSGVCRTSLDPFC